MHDVRSTEILFKDPPAYLYTTLTYSEYDCVSVALSSSAAEWNEYTKIGYDEVERLVLRNYLAFVGWAMNIQFLKVKVKGKISPYKQPWSHRWEVEV